MMIHSTVGWLVEILVTKLTRRILSGTEVLDSYRCPCRDRAKPPDGRKAKEVIKGTNFGITLLRSYIYIIIYLNIYIYNYLFEYIYILGTGNIGVSQVLSHWQVVYMV